MPWVRGLVVVGLAAGLGLAGPVVVAGAGDRAGVGVAQDVPLRDLAAERGVRIGSAATVEELRDGEYAAVSAREFDMLTPGNDMKWDATEPARGVFSFERGDAVVEAARAAGQQVRGHTLVWHSQLPGWLTEGDFSAVELDGIMRHHIAEVAGHYRGEVYAWDVVNEPFNEDGSLRDTLWTRAFGVDYVATALRAAREADPGAKLYVNDYNVEGLNAKSDALYELARDLVAAGVPLDGVGLQGHLIVGAVPGGIRENIERFAALGLDVAITELDVRMGLPVTAEKLATQAEDYRAVVEACLAVSRCVSVTTWGFTDRYSWIPDHFPGEGAALLFDEDLRPKPAYDAVHQAFGGGGAPVEGCRVGYRVTNSWSTGFSGEVVVTNVSGRPVSGWILEWDFPSGQRIDHGWNAVFSQEGTAVRARDEGWNATIGVGGSVTVGFTARHAGSNEAPVSFRLNSAGCDG
ncbi:endo-1,4-beta-xylanase [Actinoalloteichus caeruleus]|uniref:endo-1,4-beta-xylanase n=1 Tax=Actinoalloteichus cyanogriseus TaxID=2893586 RepID=UPI003AAB0B01